MAPRSTGDAAIGFRAHAGWASAVAIGGSAASPEILERRRIVTADPSIPGSKQPYHAAEGLALGRAKALIDRSTGSSRELARTGLERMVGDLRERGCAVSGCAILLASGRPLPDLEGILASHARIHAAEGELFREVLRSAARECGLRVEGLAERGIGALAAEVLGLDPAERLAAMGRAVGPPWRQDEKLAATAAWIVLAGGRAAPAAPTSAR